MSDTNTDEGATGAEDTQGVADSAPAVEPEISNAEAKKLPWVRDLMQAASELDTLKKSQAEEAARAEQAALEAKGDYEQALEMERKARQDAEANYKSELTRLQLETEFVKAGIVDPRAVKLFETDFDPETVNAAEYVASVKADEGNQLYFTDPSRRTVQKPPAAPGGQPDNFDPERDLETWLRSPDEKKRARAIAHNRAKYEAKFNKG